MLFYKYIYNKKFNLEYNYLSIKILILKNIKKMEYDDKY